MATLQCRRAESTLKRVESSRAPSVAASTRLYELTLARAYLDKAREEASEAHYGVAMELAVASQRASQRASAPQPGTLKGSD